MREINGNGVYVFSFAGDRIICLPTKNHWSDATADLDLITRGLRRLKEISNSLYPQEFFLPRLGCGNGTGNLKWSVVKPVIDGFFGKDDRFTLVNFADDE